MYPPGVYLRGPLHGCRTPSVFLELPGDHHPRLRLHRNLEFNNALQHHQGDPRHSERDRHLLRGHPLCIRRHGLLQHLRHLGPPALGGGEGKDAPGEEEGLQDGAEEPGHHRLQLPPPRGLHALRVLLHAVRVPLSDQHQRVRRHGPELQHRAAALHLKVGGTEHFLLQ